MMVTDTGYCWCRSFFLYDFFEIIIVFHKLFIYLPKTHKTIHYDHLVEFTQ